MVYKIRTFECETCGKSITGRYAPKQRFCSLQCSAESRKTSEIRICETCGNEFAYSPSPANEAKGGGKYCSRECTYIGLRTGYHPCPKCGVEVDSQSVYCSKECAITGTAQKRRTGKTVSCEYCGDPVYVPKSRLEKSAHFFCSLYHQIEWQRRNQDKYTCKICGSPFYWSPSRATDNNPTYCSLTCRDADPERVEMLREMNARQQEMSPNKLEKRAYALLDELPIEYEKQVMIADKFCVDAFIPGHDIIIQIDGDYWHGNPDKYTELDHRQQKRVNVDRSQNAYFAKCGYTILRFWGSDISKRPEWVSEQVMQAVLPPDV